MKKTLALALAVVFVLAFAAPAFAQMAWHTVTYDFEEATIELDKQVGHICNTGAEVKQAVSGTALTFSKQQTYNMERSIITMTEDSANWVAGDTGLEVWSAIKLCAPAKHEYSATEWSYTGEDDVVEAAEWNWRGVGPGPDAGVVSAGAGYEFYNWGDKYLDEFGNAFNSLREMLAFHTATSVASWNFLTTDEQLLFALADAGVTYLQYHELEALTDQEWSVRVTSDPGFSGELSQEWEAAYGPYEGWVAGNAVLPIFSVVDDNLSLNARWGAYQPWRAGTNNANLAIGWEFAYPLATAGISPYLAADTVDVPKNAFGFRVDEDGYATVEVGDDYVGNHFNMTQFARTSMGTLQRYIDISSPFSHAYLSEDMTVEGKAQVQETFRMINLSPGADKTTLWHDVF